MGIGRKNERKKLKADDIGQREGSTDRAKDKRKGSTTMVVERRKGSLEQVCMSIWGSHTHINMMLASPVKRVPTLMGELQLVVSSDSSESSDEPVSSKKAKPRVI